MVSRNNKLSGLNRSAGFTLVEIAIVLVIIGLLLGCVLKGAEMIENSKVKRAVNEINGISAAFYAYQDRYQRLPGDDGNLAALQQRGGEWPNITSAGNSNGALTVNLNQAWNAGGEQQEMWQHLRASGLISGNPAEVGAAALPRNAFSGLTAVVTQTMGGGLQGVKVCMSQVPGKAAQAIDNQLDDGQGATGKLRATLGAAGANTNPANAALANPYSEDEYYTICSAI